jgi:hypothetical protein
MPGPNSKWNDWSDLMKGNIGEPEHPLSRPLKKWTKGEKPTEEELQKERAALTRSAQLPPGIRQATDQELFGHLVVSEEELKKREEKWNNAFNEYFKAVKKPITQEQDQRFAEAWQNGKSFLESLSKAERETWEKEAFKEGMKGPNDK